MANVLILFVMRHAIPGTWDDFSYFLHILIGHLSSLFDLLWDCDDVSKRQMPTASKHNGIDPNLARFTFTGPRDDVPMTPR